MKKFRIYSPIVLLLCIIIPITYCSNGPDTGDEQNPALRIQINSSGIQNRSILPDISMEIRSYRIMGTGPGIAQFSSDITASDTVFEKDKLEPGTWTISVQAWNGDIVSGAASGKCIGMGSNIVEIEVGKTGTCNITVTPLEGNGTFRLAAQWTSNVELSEPVDSAITVSLVKAGATFPVILNNLSIDYSARTIRCDSTSLEYGYYTLRINIKYNDNKQKGFAETIRIVRGEETFANLTITTDSTGDINIIITPHMDEPISPAITLDSGNTVATVIVTGPDGNLIYICYIDGVLLNQQNSNAKSVTFNIPTALSAGSHRLDVCVYTEDYSQGGSASIQFTR